jgi:hypothetical protein
VVLLEGVVDTHLCRRCQSAAGGEDGICKPCIEGDVSQVLGNIVRAGRLAAEAGNEAKTQFLRDTYQRIGHAKPGPVILKELKREREQQVTAPPAPVHAARTKRTCMYHEHCSGPVRPYPAGEFCDHHAPKGPR